MKKKIAVPDFPKVKESYMPPDINYIQHEPSVFNGIVRVRRYRTTIQLIDEPIEVIQARLQELWDNADNYHHRAPLEKQAVKYNYTFLGTFGNKRQ